MPTYPCTGPRERVSLKRRCTQSPSASRRASSASALSRHASRQRASPVRSSSSSRDEERVRPSPHRARRSRRRGRSRGRARRGRPRAPAGRCSSQATNRTPASPTRSDDSRCGRSAIDGKTTGLARQASSASRATEDGSSSDTACSRCASASSAHDDAGRADEQRGLGASGLDRRVRRRRPEGLPPVRLVGVGDDPGDRRSHAALVPWFLG